MEAMRLVDAIGKHKKYYRCNNYRLYFDGSGLAARCLWYPNSCSIRHGYQWGRRCILNSDKYTEYCNGKSTS